MDNIELSLQYIASQLRDGSPFRFDQCNYSYLARSVDFVQSKGYFNFPNFFLKIINEPKKETT